MHIENEEVYPNRLIGIRTVENGGLEDDDFPKGFYLRRINDALWLRGYRADHLHVWNPYDHFIFVRPIKHC